MINDHPAFFIAFIIHFHDCCYKKNGLTDTQYLLLSKVICKTNNESIRTLFFNANHTFAQPLSHHTHTPKKRIHTNIQEPESDF